MNIILIIKRCPLLGGSPISLPIPFPVQVRELRYLLEQAREGLKSSEGVNTQLRVQMDKMESRMSREIEGRQAAELRRREVEIAQRGLTVSHQQLQEELAELSSQLQSEREAKALQESLYKEQIKMFQSLQSESKKAEDQKSSFISKLQAADTTKQAMEQRIAELTKVNTQLEVQMTADRQRAEDNVNRLEAEIEGLKERLQDKCQKQVTCIYTCVCVASLSLLVHVHLYCRWWLKRACWSLNSSSRVI